MHKTRLVACVAAAVTAVLPLGGAAAEPTPTDEKYLYVDIQLAAVLIGPGTVQVTYKCAARALNAVSTGVSCGATTRETLFLPGPYAPVIRTEQVPTTAIAVSATGTAVFRDGTIWNLYCTTDNVLEPTKEAACDRWQ